jgi:hypothetical protein
MRNAETTLAIIEDHHAIHAGKPTRDRVKIDKIGSLESRILGNG